MSQHPDACDKCGKWHDGRIGCAIDSNLHESVENKSSESLKEYDELDKLFHAYLGGKPDEDELEEWLEFKAGIEELLVKERIEGAKKYKESLKNEMYLNQDNYIASTNLDLWFDKYVSAKNGLKELLQSMGEDNSNMENK